MSYLPANVMGRWFHLYRKIVGAEVHDSDDADRAVHLVRPKALAEGIATTALPSRPLPSWRCCSGWGLPCNRAASQMTELPTTVL